MVALSWKVRRDCMLQGKPEMRRNEACLHATLLIGTHGPVHGTWDESAGRTGGCLSQPFRGGRVAHVVVREICFFFSEVVLFSSAHHRLGSMHYMRQGQGMRLVIGEPSLACAPNTLSLAPLWLCQPRFLPQPNSLPSSNLFPSMCTKSASLHASHPLPFSCLHFRHGNGTWNMELGLERPKHFCQSGGCFSAFSHALR